MNGAQFVMECLREEGVEMLFAYPGGAVIPLFDALYQVDYFDVYRSCHEQGGTHAVDGYARRTGKTGVCIATSGPGATNTITGIATAYSDSIPMVVITGQVATPFLYKNSFQEVDMTGISMAITKHTRLVTDANEIGEAIAEAFYFANEGRKGPVVVDITKDAFLAEVEDPTYRKREIPKDVRQFEYEAQIEEAADLIRNAKQPVIYAGGGVLRAGASEALRRLAIQSNIPVVNSIMGLGSFDRMHPLSYGVVGMHGQKETNLLVYGADVVIGAGVRFSDRAIGNRQGFTEDAKIIHIDVDKAEFDKNLDAHVQILGDLSEVLNKLADKLEGVTKPSFDKDAITAPEDQFFPPRMVLERLQEYMPENTTMVTDVGQHQMWSMMYWRPRRPNTFISSGGMGTMGFGVGAALGAKIGAPDDAVILVTGDGSFRMNHNEMLTASKYNIPMLVVVFNNNSLGMVRQWQGLFNEQRYSETDIYDPLDMDALCKAYNVEFMGQFHSPEELEELLAKYPYEEKVRVVEYVLDHDHWAYPMVAAGQSINTIIERTPVGE